MLKQAVYHLFWNLRKLSVKSFCLDWFGLNFCFVSFRFVSFRFVSFRFVSFRFVSFRFVSFRFVSFRLDWFGEVLIGFVWFDLVKDACGLVLYNYICSISFDNIQSCISSWASVAIAAGIEELHDNFNIYLCLKVRDQKHITNFGSR